MNMDHNTLLGVLIPFVGTTAGAACVFFLKNELKPIIQKTLLGFASGVMVAASVWSLLIPSMNMCEAMGRLAFLPGSIGAEKQAVYEGVAKAFRSSFRIPCTACGYCMPCPYGVDIPSCFAAYNAASIQKKTGKSQYMNTTAGFRPSHHFASLCRECGACEKRCPQKIKIRAELKKVAGEFEPFWFRPAMAVIRFLQRKQCTAAPKG